MAEYGKEALEGKQLEAAKNFGFVTDHSNPDNSNPDNSWFTTVANAFSSIPKEHIFFATLLATSHAAHAYRHVTFNTPDNSNADNFDTENSNVVHHRSTRDEPPLPLGLTEVKLTLENGNCLLAQASTHKTIMQNIPWSKIFMQCYNTPCGEEYTQNEQTYNNWYHRVSNMKIEPVDDKTGKATFSYFDTRDMSMHQGEVTHSYNLPVSLSATLSRDNNKQISEAHHHTLPNGNCMIVGESPQTPTTEFPNEWSRLYAKCLPESCNNQSFSSGENEANLSWGENLSDISIKPGKNNDTAEVFFMYYSSDNQFKSYSVEHVCDLPVLTPSIKESSSTATSTTPEKITETSLTSLITEASTPPEEITEAFIASLITEAIAKNTTQAESSTPTASQDQTTPSAEDQGWLWNKVVAPIAETAAVVVTTAVIAYALHKLRQCYNKNKTKETLDVERTNCDELSLLKIVDQIIPINDNGYTEVTKDLLGATETEDSCSVIA